MVAASWLKVTMFESGATRERNDRATDKAGIAQRPIRGQRRNRTRQWINLIPHLSFPRVAAARGIPTFGDQLKEVGVFTRLGTNHPYGC
jgi:hypothetical protein